MRRLVCLMVLVIGLAVPTVAFALVGPSSGDGTLSVRNGVGRVSLSFSGSVVGRISHGWIRVNDPIAADGSGFGFWGCEKEIPRSDTASVCSGSNIRFRALGGKYQVVTRGSGVYLSAVGHGVVQLDGAGNDPSVDYDGVFAFNDDPYRSLPNSLQWYPLAAPAGG